jgi:hypothetical protein
MPTQRAHTQKNRLRRRGVISSREGNQPPSIGVFCEERGRKSSSTHRGCYSADSDQNYSSATAGHAVIAREGCAPFAAAYYYENDCALCSLLHNAMICYDDYNECRLRWLHLVNSVAKPSDLLALDGAGLQNFFHVSPAHLCFTTSLKKLH